ncbi:beta-ketoacyl-ACP synthase III [Deltaproteobacteria bacterium TL4]
MSEFMISGSGVYTPPETISNQELADSYNRYVKQHNEAHAEQIALRQRLPLESSDPEFIEKVSGIQSRHVINRSGILDSSRMCPQIAEENEVGRSLQCEMGIQAAQEAMTQAQVNPAQIDQVIVACTAVQRVYPGIAIEIQEALGIKGFGYDLLAACASMPFGIQNACDSMAHGNATRILIVSPEICTARVDFKNRETHFIFGDAASAIIVEKLTKVPNAHGFQIIDTRLQTHFSQVVSNKQGFLNRSSVKPADESIRLFTQNGKRLLKDIVPLASGYILNHLGDHHIAISEVKRFWLHQANSHINHLICKKILGRSAQSAEAPFILTEYANTSSAGSVIAFHHYKNDFKTGEIGVLCAFGAGYSIGSVILKKT